VGKATGSRECAPDDRLRVPTIGSAASDSWWARRKSAFAHPANLRIPPHEIMSGHAARLFARAHIAPDENKVHGCGNPATLGQKQHEEYEGGTIETFNRDSRHSSRNAPFHSRAGTDEDPRD
jgi:hypothetical protein